MGVIAFTLISIENLEISLPDMVDCKGSKPAFFQSIHSPPIFNNILSFRNPFVQTIEATNLDSKVFENLS